MSTRGGAGAAITFTIVALCVALAGGCATSSRDSSDQTMPTRLSSSSSTGSSSAPGSPGEPGTTTGATASSSGPGSSDQCRTDQLGVTVGRSDTTSGYKGIPVALHNKSATSYVLDGFATVSLLDSRGQQIETAATRNKASASPMTLGVPSPTATLAGDEPPSGLNSILTTDAVTAPGHCWPTSSYLRIYPPHDTVPLVVPARLTICGDIFIVGPIGPTAPPGV